MFSRNSRLIVIIRETLLPNWRRWQATLALAAHYSSFSFCLHLIISFPLNFEFCFSPLNFNYIPQGGGVRARGVPIRISR